MNSVGYLPDLCYFRTTCHPPDSWSLNLFIAELSSSNLRSIPEFSVSASSAAMLSCRFCTSSARFYLIGQVNYFADDLVHL
jgi:hypothetical protein